MEVAALLFSGALQPSSPLSFFFPHFFSGPYYSTCCMCIVIDGAQKVVASISLNLDFFFFVFLLRFSCFFPVCLVHFFVLFPSSEATRTRASRNANSTRHLLLFLSREKKKRDERRIKKEKNQTTYGPFFVSSPLSFLYIFF